MASAMSGSRFHFEMVSPLYGYLFTVTFCRSTHDTTHIRLILVGSLAPVTAIHHRGGPKEALLRMKMLSQAMEISAPAEAALLSIKTYTGSGKFRMAVRIESASARHRRRYSYVATRHAHPSAKLYADRSASKSTYCCRYSL